MSPSGALPSATTTSCTGVSSTAGATSLPWKRPTSWSVTCGRSFADSSDARASSPRSLEGERPQAPAGTETALFTNCVEGVFSEVELPLYGVLRNSVARFCIDWSLRGAQKRFWSETLLFALFFLCTLRTIEGQCLKLSE